MVAKTFGSVLHGIDGEVVEVESVRFNSRPEIQITGLAGNVVRESRDRIRACLRGLGIDTPSAKLVVHLVPATQKKEGSQLDLAIAVAILAVEGIVSAARIEKAGFLGELRLTGEVVAIPRAIAMMQSLVSLEKLERVFVPTGNKWDASLLRCSKLELVDSLQTLLAKLTQNEWPDSPAPLLPLSDPPAPLAKPMLDYVRGQATAKRALQVALAGRHHLLLSGTPGVGKSLLSQSAPSLLPSMSDLERIEISKIHGRRAATGGRPFRAPHHSVSASALLGGGSGEIRMGEVTLAHRGVLFLDEFPEYRRDAIEGLREPLQEGVVRVSRVGSTLKLPARFLLVAAMNPCGCGYLLSRQYPCRCPPDKVAAYRRRLSGPIMDRIDLAVMMPGMEVREGISHEQAKSSIERVWNIQQARSIEALELRGRTQHWFDGLCSREFLSYRAREKLLRVARTIADLEDRPAIEQQDLIEAWALRCDAKQLVSVS
ncbi:MAG: ATP-binding protein [Bdellovibrionales bacterium]|nr:ATP-binding protein [Bdellovibrionales bacterium]